MIQEIRCAVSQEGGFTSRLPSVELNLCPSCNAFVNASWTGCLACGHSLAVAVDAPIEAPVVPEMPLQAAPQVVPLVEQTWDPPVPEWTEEPEPEPEPELVSAPEPKPVPPVEVTSWVQMTPEPEPVTISWGQPEPVTLGEPNSITSDEPDQVGWAHPNPVAWPQPVQEQQSVIDSWAPPTEWAPPPSIDAPAAAAEPVQAQEPVSSWASDPAPLLGFQYDTPSFATSMPSANDSRLRPELSKRIILLMCLVPLGLAVIAFAGLFFLGTSETADDAKIAVADAPEATTTTLPGGWVSYIEPSGLFGAQLPSQPTASTSSTSDGPVLVWTSPSADKKTTVVVLRAPLPKGANPTSQTTLKDVASTAASSAGMTIKGQIFETQLGVTHLDVLMTSAKGSANVRYFVSESYLYGLSVTTADQANDPSAFSTLTKSFKLKPENATPVSAVPAPSAPTTAAAKSPIADWISYSDPGGSMTAKFPVTPKVETRDDIHGKDFIGLSKTEEAEVAIATLTSGSTMTAEDLKNVLSQAAETEGLTVKSQSTSTVNGTLRVDATMTGSGTKVVTRVAVKGNVFYTLAYYRTSSTSDAEMQKTFDAFAASLVLGKSS